MGPRTVCAVLLEEEEMKIPWKEAQEGLPVPEDQYQERFWRRRLDGIGLDTVNRVKLLAIEFKRTQDMRSNYAEEATKVAQKQLGYFRSPTAFVHIN